MLRFYVDAETDGLYGSFLSVAALVTDGAGVELDRFYGAVAPEARVVTSEWARENVVPHLSRAERLFPAEKEMLEAFWAFWMAYRERAECVADVCYPVEARLFSTCVAHDAQAREFLGPYPLLDLSTLLRARGLDVDADRAVLAGIALTRHDALDDVRLTASLWERLAGADA